MQLGRQLTTASVICPDGRMDYGGVFEGFYLQTWEFDLHSFFPAEDSIEAGQDDEC